MSYLVIVLSCVASYPSYLVVYVEWLNLAIGSLNILLYRQRYIFSPSYDKCTYCKSLWIKAYAKCKCIAIYSVDLPMMPLVGSAGGSQESASLGRFFGPALRTVCRAEGAGGREGESPAALSLTISRIYNAWQLYSQKTVEHKQYWCESWSVPSRWHIIPTG